MAYKIITPRQLPIDLPTLRLQLKIDEPNEPWHEDELIKRYAAGACAHAQHYMGCAVGEQTIELALDQFPSGPIQLPLAPALSVESVRYVDAAGQWQGCPADSYVLDDFSSDHWLLPAFGSGWPASAPVANAVRVRYVAGFKADSLPEAVAQALLLLVTHYYEKRGITEDVPTAANYLLNTEKKWGV